MIRRQITLPATTDRVWEALIDPEQASSWFGGHIEWDLEEGGALRYTDDDGSRRSGWIDVVRPGRYLRYRWWGEPESEASEVSYLLEPDGDGTLLTIQERTLVPGRATLSATPAAPEASAGTATATASTSTAWTRWDGLSAAVWAILSAPAFCGIVA